MGTADLFHQAPFEPDPDEEEGPGLVEPGHLLRRRLVGVRRLPFADEDLDPDPISADPLEKIGLRENAGKHGEPVRFDLSPGRLPEGGDEHGDQGWDGAFFHGETHLSPGTPQPADRMPGAFVAAPATQSREVDGDGLDGLVRLPILPKPSFLVSR